MKAHVLYGVNDLKYENVERPVPGEGEVLLKVETVGICGSDIPRIYETGAHRHPIIPGHEFAGTICEVGEGAETEFYSIRSGASSAYPNAGEEVKAGWDKESIIGRRVGVFPLIPCGQCGPCKKKQYEMCRNYNYLGSRCDGGFAEYVKVPVWNLIELPDNVSFEDAAMLEPTAVGAHAMRRMFSEELSLDNACGISDMSIAVIGLGTIGLLLTMHLLGSGAERFYVVGNKDFQREKALELGIKPDRYCDSRKENVVEWLLEKTSGVGADAIFECVGKNETYSQAIESLAPAGRLMLVGNPASDMKLDKNIYWKILRNQLNVLGTWNSSFTGCKDDDWHYVVDRLAAGAIAPSKLISHRLHLSQLEKGLHIMRDKTEDYVKVMIIPD